MGIAIVGILVILMIMAVVTPRLEKFQGCDKFLYGNIVAYVSSAFDFWTDLLLVFLLYCRCEYILFYASCVFTIVPFMLSLGFIIYWIQRWRLMTTTASHR